MNNINISEFKNIHSELQPDHGYVFDFIYMNAIIFSIITFIFLSENGCTKFLCKLLRNEYDFRGVKIKYYNIFLGFSGFFGMWYICKTKL